MPELYAAVLEGGSMKNSSKIDVRIPGEMRAELSALATERNISIGQLVRECVVLGLYHKRRTPIVHGSPRTPAMTIDLVRDTKGADTG